MARKVESDERKSCGDVLKGAKGFKPRSEEDAMFAHFRRRPVIVLVGAVALAVAMAGPAAAPPGDLDTTFDGDGKVTTDFAGGNDQGYGLALQTDGKIVVAGIAGFVDFGLARYKTDGSLDTAFDGDGKVTTDFAGSGDQGSALAIQVDGKIVAAGTAFTGTADFALARYNTDGSLDTTFDTDGLVTTNITSSDQAWALALQGDGKIVAAGLALVSGNFDFAVARYNADGSIDATFSGDGKVTTDFGFAFDEARGVAIQADGKIVVAGRVRVAGNPLFGLARYNADGSLDSTFDGDGRVTTDFAGGIEEAWALALQGDGNIVAAGAALGSGTGDFALARYNTDGSLDTTFDADGLVTTDFAGSAERAFGVALQTDGKIVAAGEGFTGASSDFALARYKADGSLDTTFSADGRVTTDFAGETDQAWGVALQGDKKIVAAGFARASGIDDFALARYTCLRRTSRPMSIPLCP